jgi:hypothetical protein
VNLSEIDDDKFKVSKEDKDLNKKFTSDKMAQTTISNIENGCMMN